MITINFSASDTKKCSARLPIGIALNFIISKRTVEPTGSLVLACFMFYVHILVQRFKTYLKPPVVVDIVDDVGVHVHVDVGFDNDSDIALCPYGLGHLYGKALRLAKSVRLTD